MDTEWSVYVLVSPSSGATYVGVTTDLERRLAQHNGDVPGGARRTRSGRPWGLGAVYGPFPDRGRAQKAEYQVRRLRGPERLTWAVPDDLE
ncbi:MAG TPA: GIY-YIG nuclease family protein [Planctomycetota bacterium]|jgi:putative endonuclease|nr:GIY-YIG nuclease family protein [Planctomycetota bacterium]